MTETQDTAALRIDTDHILMLRQVDANCKNTRLPVINGGMLMRDDTGFAIALSMDRYGHDAHTARRMGELVQAGLLDCDERRFSTLGDGEGHWLYRKERSNKVYRVSAAGRQVMDEAATGPITLVAMSATDCRAMNEASMRLAEAAPEVAQRLRAMAGTFKERSEKQTF